MLSPRRPHIFKGLLDWIGENNLTPYIIVDLSRNKVLVPKSLEGEEQIVFNISSNAVRYLDYDLKTIVFEAKFGGKPETLTIPFSELLGIYAKENGAGMMFEEESYYLEHDDEDSSPPLDDSKSDKSEKHTKKGHLTLVK